MSDDTKDRRRQRSEDPDEAVELQIAHVAEAFDYRALVLADDVGRVLASVGDEDIADVLSNLAMWADFNGHGIDELTLQELRDFDVDIDESEVRMREVLDPSIGGSCQLIALGHGLVTTIGLNRAAAGIERIRRAASA